MNNQDELIRLLEFMKTQTLKNYVIAGLDSSLIQNGCVRYFENSRDHQDFITPHSHRFDFACIVLEGTVANSIWEPTTEEEGDFFQTSFIHYDGKIGDYDRAPDGRNWYKAKTNLYRAGDIYSMTTEQIHSIKFGRGAKVLFFEGPSILDCSLIIEPVVDGEVIKTLETKDYMFKKEGDKSEALHSNKR